MCSEFVTAQDHVLVTTQPNMNDLTNLQVYTTRFQGLSSFIKLTNTKKKHTIFILIHKVSYMTYC